MLSTLDAKLRNLSLMWKQWEHSEGFELRCDMVQCKLNNNNTDLTEGREEIREVWN